MVVLAITITTAICGLAELRRRADKRQAQQDALNPPNTKIAEPMSFADQFWTLNEAQFCGFALMGLLIVGGAYVGIQVIIS